MHAAAMQHVVSQASPNDVGVVPVEQWRGLLALALAPPLPPGSYAYMVYCPVY